MRFENYSLPYSKQQRAQIPREISNENRKKWWFMLLRPYDLLSFSRISLCKHCKLGLQQGPPLFLFDATVSLNENNHILLFRIQFEWKKIVCFFAVPFLEAAYCLIVDCYLMKRYQFAMFWMKVAETIWPSKILSLEIERPMKMWVMWGFAGAFRC